MRDKIVAVTLRPTPDPELVPLVRAIKARIDGLGDTLCTPKDGGDIYHRDKTPFLQLELKRDHMSLDLWLAGEQLDEARASGIARAHPFLGDEAVKVRFERAEDLSRVARWIEASYAYAVERAKGPPPKPVEKATPLISLPPTPSRPSAPAVVAVESPSSIPGPSSSGGATKGATKPGAAPKAADVKAAEPKKAPAKVKAPAKKAARGSAGSDGGSKAKKATPVKAKKKAAAAKTKAKAAKPTPKKKR